MDPEKLLLTPAEAGKRTGRSEATIRRMAKRGEIPHTIFGGVLRIPAEPLRKHIEETTSWPRDPAETPAKAASTTIRPKSAGKRRSLLAPAAPAVVASSPESRVLLFEPASKD